MTVGQPAERVNEVPGADVAADGAVGGTGVGRMDQEYNTPPIVTASLRRRPAKERSAA